MDRKLNVLIVHNYYQIPGGEDSVVANEKKALEECGYRVLLYTRTNLEIKKMTILKKIMLPFTSIFNWKTYREIKRLVKERKIDVVHVHNTLSLISPSVYYASLSCNVPVVQTIHNFRLLCPGATFYRTGHICEECIQYGLMHSIKHSCYRDSRIQTFICALSTWIHRKIGIYGKLNYICLTEFNKDKLLNIEQIKAENIFIKPNFVIDKVKNVPYEERDNQFIFAGRLDKLKGIDVLLKAWKIIGENAPRLIICGTGPMSEWCEKYIFENELSMVELLGYVENIKVMRLIGESRALILPTQWYEGFPMTIAEAYSRGTPVIGSNIGNVGSIINHGINGWKFNSDYPEELADIVMHISGDDLDFTSDKILLDKEKNVNALLNIYSKIICRRNS